MTSRVDWEDLAFDHGFSNDKEMLNAWYDKLMTQDEIGAKLGLHGSTIGKRMKVLGLTTRERNDYPH